MRKTAEEILEKAERIEALICNAAIARIKHKLYNGFSLRYFVANPLRLK